MGIVTIIRFLFGQRQAIQDIAASRHALWLGLLFVLSAGFAREYDGEDLLHEPWHLLLPLAASLVTSTLLFALLWLVLHGWRTWPNEWRTYQSFLALYWMTAPLAWVYSIPVERFMSPVGATQANLWFLGIVALWRVVLMIRVIEVMFQAHLARVIIPLMLFADTVLLTLTMIVPVPIFAIMGGVRLSESEQMIAGITFLTMIVGFYSWFVWALGTLIALCIPASKERVPSFSTLPTAPVARSAWLVAAGSLLVWVVILPVTQPEQQLRWKVENQLTNRRITDALALMSRHELRDFPPHWDPPPRSGWRNDKGPPMVDVMQKLSHPEVAPWVRELYRRKFNDHFQRDFGAMLFWGELSDDEFDRYLDMIERYPLPQDMLGEQREAAEHASGNRTAARRERLRFLLLGPAEPTEVATPPNPDAAPQTPLADE